MSKHIKRKWLKIPTNTKSQRKNRQFITTTLNRPLARPPSQGRIQGGGAKGAAAPHPDL